MKFKKSKKPDFQPLNFTLDPDRTANGERTPRLSAGRDELAVADFVTPLGGAGPAPGIDRDKALNRESMVARYAYPAAAAASVIWAACMVTFALSYNTPDWAFDFQPVQITLLVIVAVAPTVLMALTAYSIRQSALLTAEAERARAATDALVAPAVLAAGVTGNVVKDVRTEISRAMAVAAEASQQLSVLRLALSQESDRMSATVADAERAARLLTASLSHERLEMGTLSAELDTRAQAVAGSIQRQAKMVAEASDLAQSQVREAEAALAARTADLAAAAADAGELTTLAGQQIGLNADRLETMGKAVEQQLNAVWKDMDAERAQLEGISENLRLENAAVANMLETHRGQLLDAVAHARVSTDEIQAAAASSAETLRNLVAEAASQVGALADTARAEQDAMDAQVRARLKLFASVVADERAAIEADSRQAIESLTDAAEAARNAAMEKASSATAAVTDDAREAIETLSRAADDARASAQNHLETAREVAANHADASRAQMEQLAEAAYAAGQRADEIYDARIAAARSLIEESTRLVEEAGLRSAQKIEIGLTATRNALTELEALLSEVDARAGRLPNEAQASVEAVRDAISKGVEELTIAARRAAEETQEIDAAFQDRVRRNYEMLSDSVRLMTQVASDADATAPMAQIEPPVLKPVEPVPAPPEIAAVLARAKDEAEAANAAAVEAEAPRMAVGAGASTMSSAPARRIAHDNGDDEGPLLNLGGSTPSPAAAARPRLRLTASDPAGDDVMNVFQPARTERRPREDEGDWTWRDLLKNVDGGDLPTDVALANRLISEIEALGIDTATLLPQSRIDEIARALSDGDLDAGRDSVRRLAPAAVRRLSRRMEAEPNLRSDGTEFTRTFGDLVVDALARGIGAAAGLLGSDQGRIFLLLDAAVSHTG